MLIRFTQEMHWVVDAKAMLGLFKIRELRFQVSLGWHLTSWFAHHRRESLPMFSKLAQGLSISCLAFSFGTGQQLRF